DRFRIDAIAAPWRMTCDRIAIGRRKPAPAHETHHPRFVQKKNRRPAATERALDRVERGVDYFRFSLASMQPVGEQKERFLLPRPAGKAGLRAAALLDLSTRLFQEARIVDRNRRMRRDRRNQLF